MQELLVNGHAGPGPWTSPRAGCSLEVTELSRHHDENTHTLASLNYSTAAGILLRSQVRGNGALHAMGYVSSYLFSYRGVFLSSSVMISMAIAH